MQNFKIYLACLSVVCLLTASCSKEEGLPSGDDPANQGTLTFGAFLNDLVTNNSGLKQAVSGIPQCSENFPAFVEIVLTQGDNPVVGSASEPLRISVNPNPQDYDEDGVEEYFTDESASLELDPGTYSLEYFTVLDSEEDVIWVAPTRSGDFGALVDDPLPLNIELNAGVKKYVDVEVLCFDDRYVNEYGYLFFNIDQHQAFEFCFFANYCPPEGERHFPAAYSVDIWIGSDTSGVLLYGDETNELDFNENNQPIARPRCFVLPDLAQYGDEEDYFYYEVTLLDWEGAYGNVEPVVISGTLSRADIVANFDGEDRVDYEHLLFGCADSPPGGDCPEGDLDCDGVPNEDDLCPGSDDQMDTDGDGVPNQCDACPGSDDKTDSDNDSIADGCDVCNGFDDGADADEDGIPDGCEEDSGDCSNDADCDGIPNGDDNCHGYSDNKDADSDGIPDGCDECPNDSSDTCEDEDYDTIDGCETAFMKGDKSFFKMNFKNNRWGWAHHWTAGNTSRTFEFWAAAGKNDTNKGTRVGDITIDVNDGMVDVTIDMTGAHELRGAHIYLEKDKPTVNSPGQYTYHGSDLAYSLEIENYNNGGFWIIVHADVCATDAN